MMGTGTGEGRKVASFDFETDLNPVRWSDGAGSYDAIANATLLGSASGSLIVSSSWPKSSLSSRCM